jgi:ribonucleoside-diphosphate reductase alpha subunit
MFVQKRNGTKELVQFDKITKRIENMAHGLSVEVIALSQRVINGVYDNVSTSELDELSSTISASLVTTHTDYDTLASRLIISNLHKTTDGSFKMVTSTLWNHTSSKTRRACPLLSSSYVAFVEAHMDTIEDTIDYQQDYQYDYFGLKTLMRSYLVAIDGKIIERPQDLLMRVACGIHIGDIDAAVETYKLLSEKWFIHASPTLFNAGTPNPQMSSCYLLTMKDDSVDGIFDTLKQCAAISKYAGGIGLSISTIRASGSYIAGTNGQSNGIIPMLRVFNNTARYVDQGGGKRKGAFAVYLEPWHADIREFLDLRKNNGVEENRTRDLFLGLWIPDLFMERVEKNLEWSLFCPNEAPGLSDVHGDDFRVLYERYESENIARECISARKLWFHILDAQIETGVPYILYKDACNSKSNQKNLGTIRGSNLCTEIIQYSSPEESAVCNLASISLPRFIKGDKTFDHETLFNVTKIICTNLNKIIDSNHYPTKEAERSNKLHRPIGIGVQGLADVFALLKIPFDGESARKLNRDIFETIYFAACTRSMELSKKDGPYSSFDGSPISEGKFQFDLWNEEVGNDRWDWSTLRDEIREHGVRNSLMIAPMPTASTSQILGNNECFEPFTSNIYVRRTLAGEFVCISKHLVRDLLEEGLWSPAIKDQIIGGNGSIQHISVIPEHIRRIYKTVWEIKGKCLIDMARDRGVFIDQSQSFNVHMIDATISKLTSLHFYTWKQGLKTGMYYLRTRAAADALKITLCSVENKDACISCSG